MSIMLMLYFRSIKRKIVSYNMKLFNILWLRRKDSNLQPLGYEPSELPSAPPRDVNKYKYGGGKGIRTPAPSPTSWFSRPVPSTRLGYSSSYIWCLRPDLNRHVGLTTQDFKSCASTYSATQAKKMVSRWRFELQTLWLKVKCSTDWASGT